MGFVWVAAMVGMGRGKVNGLGCVLVVIVKVWEAEVYEKKEVVRVNMAGIRDVEKGGEWSGVGSRENEEELV